VNVDTVAEPISELQSVTCRMGSRSVTRHPTQVNMPYHNPSQDSIYLPQRDDVMTKDQRLRVRSLSSYYYCLFDLMWHVMLFSFKMAFS